MKTEGTNLLLLTISASGAGHLDELHKAEKYLIRWSLYTCFTVYMNFSNGVPMALRSFY